jgi:predicted lipid-binding transport protein (Tim44 family)
MHKARFRVMAGLAGATLCLFAVAANGQSPTTTTPTGAAGAGVDPQTAQPTTPTPTDQTTPAPAATDANGTITSTAPDVSTTTTTTRSFPGGMLGILAVAALVLLLLFGLFRGRDRTVVRDTYVATPPVTNTRTVTTSTTADDRMNLNSRAASGPGTNPGAGINDPNARR